MKKRMLSLLLLTACVLTLAACEKTPSSDPTENHVSAQPPEVVVMSEPSDPVDYTTGVFTWVYYLQGEGETLQTLNGIDSCQYGTAGSSLQQASAAAGVLMLTGATDLETVLRSYLDGMNTTQRDFFSFQWQMNSKKAKTMLADPAAWQGLLSDCGRGDVDLTAYTPAQVDAITETVLAVLKEKGVEDVWKSHTDEEPFAHWQP